MDKAARAISAPSSLTGNGRAGMPNYVQQVIAEARDTVLEAVVRRAPVEARSLTVMSVMRDERALVAEFLAHYRSLGAERFVILDNGSTDGTAELLAAEPDVDLYIVRRRFLPPYKQGWINRAIALYGYDRWYVYADADEHLVFEGAGQRSLRDVIELAEARGLRRLRGMLVDMYPPGPVFTPGTVAPLAARFPLFDSDSYRETVCKQRLSRKGGPRPRAIASPEFPIDPELTKYPVFHIRAGEVFDNPHHLYPYTENFRAPCHLGILHYKFGPGLVAKSAAASVERNYYGDSVEYRSYLHALEADRHLVLAYPGTRSYRGPKDLIAAGLIEPIGWPEPARGGWVDRLRRAAAALRTSAPATSAQARPTAAGPCSGR